MESRLEAVPAGAAHLDTVRTLHQTVVSLRTALEVSKNELKELKQRYELHSHCLDYSDVIEKLTLENHILRRRIIDSGPEGKPSPNIKLEVTYSPKQDVEEYSEVVIHTATTDVNSTIECGQQYEDNRFCSSDKLNEEEESVISQEENVCDEIPLLEDNIEELSPVEENIEVTNEDLELSPNEIDRDSEDDPNSPIASSARLTDDTQPNFKTRLELLSKFDVRIKVRTIKEGTIISSTTSDSDSTVDEKKDKGFDKESTKPTFKFEEKREHIEKAGDLKGNWINLKSVSSENIKMAVPNEADAKAKVDKFDVQVRITSEENLVVKEHVERTKRNRDTLNLDVDDLSLRSMSEGDNSVFSEGVTTPLEPQARGEDKEEGSGNESEEVDDIELIFTTDESKDMSMNLQEDLVSIRESGDGDTWGPCSASTQSTHSTPVLIKFHTLDPDFQSENQENTTTQGAIPESALKLKRVSLPNDKEFRHVAFNGKGSLDLPGRGILKSCDNKSDNMLYKRSPNTSTRRLDSVDSLTCEYNRGLSFDNTKSSSFELGSSMDILHREESMDSFGRNAHLGHRFSVFAETDISKCGISEEDLVSGLNVRRNTCPNPFQYRPASSRYGSRVAGPLKAGAGRVRPVLREAAAAGARRESAAQTDVCALPPRWSSDGHLAYKLPANTAAPTLPTRGAGLPRRPTVPDARPPALLCARRTDDSRRVMLSDIGFTSMVPELSRSADPVWALAKRPPATDSSPVSTSTSKFLSRGSSFRSPCVSIDRSNDLIRQNIYVPVKESRWRASLPDVRRDDTDDLLEEAENYLRRSIDNLRSTPLDLDRPFGQTRQSYQAWLTGQAGLTDPDWLTGQAGLPGLPWLTGQPYIPAEPKQLRLGHIVKIITPQGRVAVGRVRYVGIAGGTAAASCIMVGAELPLAQYPGLARNDGTHRERRYFLTSRDCTALFVPFNKVVMAWSN